LAHDQGSFEHQKPSTNNTTLVFFEGTGGAEPLQIKFIKTTTNNKKYKQVQRARRARKKSKLRNLKREKEEEEKTRRATALQKGLNPLIQLEAKTSFYSMLKQE
jgi:hypothetical protein